MANHIFDSLKNNYAYWEFNRCMVQQSYNNNYSNIWSMITGKKNIKENSKYQLHVGIEKHIRCTIYFNCEQNSVQLSAGVDNQEQNYPVVSAAWAASVWLPTNHKWTLGGKSRVVRYDENPCRGFRGPCNCLARELKHMSSLQPEVFTAFHVTTFIPHCTPNSRLIWFTAARRAAFWSLPPC